MNKIFQKIDHDATKIVRRQRTWNEKKLHW